MTQLRSQLAAALGAGFIIERELGGGGMSRVFLARERRFDRLVVVKVLAPDLAHGVSSDRFEQEIRRAGGLQHPHIVPVLAAGDVDGLAYFTMPYIQGESLRQRLDAADALSIAESIALFRDVASALECAHANGLVHRDIKPDNVLLSGGHAMIADFGVAKAIQAATAADRTAGLTAAGMVVGTPAYMPPEQAAGDPATDYRADLYAFGTLAYECLTGAPPFAGRSGHAVIAAHIAELPAEVTERRPDIPPALAALIMQCLAKAPAERPGSAGEIRRRLEAMPVSGVDSATAAMPRPAPGRDRRRSIVVMAGLAILALISVIAFSLRHRPREAVAHVALAVLPFQNAGPDSTAYFADGLTEAITTRLASLPQLTVIDPQSAAQYAHTSKPLAQIGRELGVTYVLRGTVRWAANGGALRARVTPSLIRVADATTRWAGEPSIVTPTDVFAVQSSIAGGVVASLGLLLGDEAGRRLNDTLTANHEAYDTYLRARSLQVAADRAGAFSRLAYGEPLTLYQRAITLDPRFAMARVRLAEVLSRVAMDEGQSHEVFAQAQAQIDTALSLEPNLAEAFAVRAFAFSAADRDVEAEAAFKYALVRDPNNSTALTFLALLWRAHGRWSDADTLLRRALLHDPRNRELIDAAGWIAARLRQDRRVDSLSARLVELDPGDATGYLIRLEMALRLGDTISGRRLTRETLRAVARPPALFWRAITAVGDSERELVLNSDFSRVGNSDRRDSLIYLVARASAAVGLHRAATDMFELVRAQALRLGASVQADSTLGVGYAGIAAAFSGRRAGAQDAAEWLKRLPDSLAVAVDFTNLFHLAVIQAQMGDVGGSVRSLRLYLQKDPFASRALLRLSPLLLGLHGNPDFQQLMADRNLP